MNTLHLRPATMNDAKILFAWANDPVVRASAFIQEPIEWKAHIEWLQRKLEDADCTIFVAEDAGVPIGQIRFDREQDVASTDVHLAPEMRGKGYGTTLISSGMEAYFNMTNINRVTASVKTENAASAKTFEKAGFTKTGTGNEHGCDVIFFERKRNA